MTGEGRLAFLFYSKSELLLLDILSWLAVPAFWCDCAGSACGHCEVDMCIHASSYAQHLLGEVHYALA